MINKIKEALAALKTQFWHRREKLGPITDEEKLALGRWIKQGQSLIVGTSALGDSYLDPNVKRDEDIEKKSQDYVAFDHQVAEELPHLSGRFRWDLEKYYRGRYGPYLPQD